MAGLTSAMPRLRLATLRESRVDRPGWTAGICIETYLVRVVEHAAMLKGERGEARETARQLLDWLDPSRNPSAAGR